MQANARFCPPPLAPAQVFIKERARRLTITHPTAACKSLIPDGGCLSIQTEHINIFTVIWTKIKTFETLESLKVGDLITTNPEVPSRHRVIVALGNPESDEAGKLEVKQQTDAPEIVKLTHFEILSESWWTRPG